MMRRRLGSVAAVLLLFTGLLAPLANPRPAAAAPRYGVLQTVGDFLSLGANTVRELQEAIELASGEAAALLQGLKNDLESLVQTLSEAYQDNLNITLNSLDAFTRNKLFELQALVDQVNRALQDDIRLIGQEARDVIRQAGLRVRQATAELEQSLKNVVVVAGETGAFLVDRVVFTAILVIALVLLGLGLLLFIFLLFTRRVPAGWVGVLVLGLMGVFVLLNGALVLSPSVRLFVITFTGLGLQERLEAVADKPRILDVLPDPIILGDTREVDVWGSHLRLNGTPPTATIGLREVPVNAASDQRVVVDVASLDAPDGSTNLVLRYGGEEGPAEVVRLARATPVPQPPDLEIVGFALNPPSPVEDGNTRATLTVRNAGGGPAQNFVLQWQPFANSTATAIKTLVDQLAPGASRSFTFDFAYPNAGAFDTLAVVDPPPGTVAETSEANNSRALRVNVQPRPPRQVRVTVVFDRVTIHDDSDGVLKGEGDLYFDFNVNGQRRRFPGSGTRDMGSGETHNLGVRFDLTLAETEALTLFANGTDVDDVDEDDAMGSVSVSFGRAQNWGQGAHSDRSRQPNNYTLHYQISVTQP
jgi:hypothetical protein